MRICAFEDRVQAGPVRASTSLDRDAILRVAAERLDPVLLPLGFQRGTPGHWTGTRFPWHEDVLIEVDAASSRRGAVGFSLEIFAGVPRRGIGDPVPGTPFVRCLEGCAREVAQARLGADGRMVVADDADLQAWLAFVAEHLAAAVARVRGDGSGWSRSADR